MCATVTTMLQSRPRSLVSSPTSPNCCCPIAETLNSNHRPNRSGAAGANPCRPSTNLLCHRLFPNLCHHLCLFLCLYLCPFRLCRLLCNCPCLRYLSLCSRPSSLPFLCRKPM